MTNWIGADTAALRALGDTFAEQADRLDLAVAALGGRMATVNWQGTDLAGFHDTWTQQHRTALLSAAVVLRSRRDQLVANADDQDRASAADGGLASGGSDLFCPVLPPTVGGGGGGPGDIDDLHDDLVAALGMTPVQQAQWWDGLTDEERALFLAERPGLAAQLADGVLTDDERAQVTETLLDLAAGSTTVSEVVNRISAEGRAFHVSFGAAGSATVSERADGTVAVTLGGEIAAGVEFGDKDDLGGGVELVGGLSTTYVFDSAADADRFVDDLVFALVPEWEWDEAKALAGGRYVTEEYREVLDRHADSHSKVTGFLALNGDVSIGLGDGAKVEVGAGFKVEQNFTDGSRTYTLSADVAGKLGDNGAAVGVDVALGTDADNNLTSLTLKTDGKLTTDGKVELPFGPTVASELPASKDNPHLHQAESKGTLGATGAATMVVDLQNPENRRLATEFLAAATAGDSVRMAEVGGQLVHDSRVTLQVGMQEKVNNLVDLDLKAVELQVGSTASQQNAWVKVEGTDEFRRVDDGRNR